MALHQWLGEIQVQNGRSAISFISRMFNYLKIKISLPTCQGPEGTNGHWLLWPVSPGPRPTAQAPHFTQPGATRRVLVSSPDCACARRGPCCSGLWPRGCCWRPTSLLWACLSSGLVAVPRAYPAALPQPRGSLWLPVPEGCWPVLHPDPAHAKGKVGVEGM